MFVVEMAGRHGNRAELRFLWLDHVADVEELVVPDVERGKPEVGDLHDIRNDAAGDRRHLLLSQRRVRHDREVDRVAARLFVIGDRRFERDVLLRREALVPPHLGGSGNRVGDIRPRQCAGRGEPQ